MKAKVTLDKAGRLVIPKSMRQALQLGPGDTLEIETDDDRLIISPVRVRPSLLKEQGVWVFRCRKQENGSIPDLVEHERDKRTRELLEDRR